MKRFDDDRSLDAFLLDGDVKLGPYQARTSTGGKRDVYYSRIEGASFIKTRKVPLAVEPAPRDDPAVAAVSCDLARMELSAPVLLEREFAI